MCTKRDFTSGDSLVRPVQNKLSLPQSLTLPTRKPTYQEIISFIVNANTSEKLCNSWETAEMVYMCLISIALLGTEDVIPK